MKLCRHPADRKGHTHEADPHHRHSGTCHLRLTRGHLRIVSGITRTPELSPEVIQARWIRNATGPEVGARFLAVNSFGGIWRWPNFPVVISADPGREFAISRTEPFFGTLEWRYQLLP